MAVAQILAPVKFWWLEYTICSPFPGANWHPRHHIGWCQAQNRRCGWRFEICHSGPSQVGWSGHLRISRAWMACWWGQMGGRGASPYLHRRLSICFEWSFAIVVMANALFISLLAISSFMFICCVIACLCDCMIVSYCIVLNCTVLYRVVSYYCIALYYAVLHCSVM